VAERHASAAQRRGRQSPGHHRGGSGTLTDQTAQVTVRRRADFAGITPPRNW
jgi:hypothetical protein